jgi:hypothetical protein
LILNALSYVSSQVQGIARNDFAINIYYSLMFLLLFISYYYLTNHKPVFQIHTFWDFVHEDCTGKYSFILTNKVYLITYKTLLYTKNLYKLTIIL